MALLTEDSTCSLCRKRIDQAGPFFASTAVGDESGEQLLQHSDAAIHWECLFRWPGVERFLRLVYAAHRRFFIGNRCWTVLAVTDRYHVAQSAWVVDVSIAQTGMNWQIDVKKWPNGLQLKLTDGSLDVLPQSRRALTEQAINELLTSVPALSAAALSDLILSPFEASARVEDE